jgi:hypothetical protein
MLHFTSCKFHLFQSILRIGLFKQYKEIYRQTLSHISRVIQLGRENAGNFLTSWEPVSISRRTLLHGVIKYDTSLERYDAICHDNGKQRHVRLLHFNSLKINPRENHTAISSGRPRTRTPMESSQYAKWVLADNRKAWSSRLKVWYSLFVTRYQTENLYEIWKKASPLSEHAR